VLNGMWATRRATLVVPNERPASSALRSIRRGSVAHVLAQKAGVWLQEGVVIKNGKVYADV
jgi:hypothetical protein